MKVIGGPYDSTGDTQGGKTSIWVALLIASLASGGVVLFFPFVLFVIMIAMVPGISDIAWAIAQFPIKLFGVSLPESGRTDQTLLIAGRIYAAVVFIVVFALVLRRGRKQHKEKSVESNEA